MSIFDPKICQEGHTEKLECLESENAKLKAEIERLKKIIQQGKQYWEGYSDAEKELCREPMPNLCGCTVVMPDHDGMFSPSIVYCEIHSQGLSADSWKALAGKMEEHVVHRQSCIRTLWEAGEPTAGGGYRTMYAGKWYQTSPVDELPKCECGVDEILAAYESAVKENGNE